MKTVIYCFSGTGNSLSAAKSLANALDGTTVVPIAKAIKGEIKTDADRVGIVFPVYAFGMPRIVVEFCKKIEIASSARIFAVATCGGMPAGTLLQLKKILAGRGLTLSAGFCVTMPGNYTPLYGAPSDEKQRAILEKAKKRIEYIAEAVKAGKPTRIEANNFLINWIFSGLLYRVSIPHLCEADKYFWANDNCNSCGVCRNVCPVANIEMKDGRPVWQHKCEQCMACLQWCPTEAIQWGKKTQRRKRYRNPDVTVQDIICLLYTSPSPRD